MICKRCDKKVLTVYEEEIFKDYCEDCFKEVMWEKYHGGEKK